MEKCWEIRGCPEELKANCTFNKKGKNCELHCHFQYCPGSSKIISDFKDFIGLDLSSFNIKKEKCLFCEYLINEAKKIKK
ncbi:MAG: hypothetical protein KAS39_06170 [Actinomycetia bacterium]|nr:hypothetical protein [Actinomycetes bacterium]